jgi:predicted metal-dependent hydrolase
VLQVRPETSLAQKQMLLDAWYREQIKEAAPPLIQKWEKLMSVTVNNFYVQKMKTKWGSCNVESNNIRLNSELAKKPIEYLEYVIVHELAHLIEPTHNSRFLGLMEQFMPKWRAYRDQLNQLPVQG